MVLNSLFPVFALVVLGVCLKHFKITGEVFLQTSDRLVYFIFFPAMLFWKIGGAKTGAGIPWRFCGAALAAKFRGDGDIAIHFVGDGASNQGMFLESLNLASVWDLPAVFVV